MPSSLPQESDSPGQGSSRQPATPVEKAEKTIWIVRSLFVGCLVAAAATIGGIFHHFLAESEKKLAYTHFDAIADRALTEASDILLSKRWAGIALSSLAAELQPNASQWPNVFIPGFERLAYDLKKTTSSKDYCFAPIVRPPELPSWEAFAYDYYYNRRKPQPFPNTTAVSSFGRGVWSFDPTSSAPDKHSRDDGTLLWESSYEILAPVFQVDEGVDDILLYNLHSTESRGGLIDKMLDCVAEKVTRGVHLEEKDFPYSMEDEADRSCAVILRMGQALKYPTRGPASLIFQPIRPANDRTKVTGVIMALTVWDELLEGVFTGEVQGVDCVLENEFESYTYRIENGKVTTHGPGDSHQPAYDHKKKKRRLTPPDLYAEQSPIYSLSLYPTAEFCDSYMTLNPILASVGSVCIILLTSVFFFLYDSYVNKERLYARDLLEAKRRFMRFVSHEVRTPLNAVCMGLAVMNSEIEPCVPTAGKESLTEEKEASLRTTGTPRDGARLFPTDSGATEFLALLTDVQVNAQSAVDVLNDMLNYDKVERRALALELDVLRPWHLIENVVNEFRLSAASKNIILSWTVATSGQRERGEGGTIDDMPQEADHASFLGDPVRIKQVLRNLISNAIKFTPEQGSVRIQVTAKESSKDHNWQTLKTTPKTSIRVRQCGTCKVQITDSGVGMSQDQLGKLFGEDVQFNRNTLQNGQGSGLGLYISKGIVERHNGILSAQSKGLGKGTTLTLKLPLYHVAQDGDKKPLSEPRADTSSTLETCMIEMPAPQNLHILLVDDVSSNRKLLKRLLERKGHTCDEAINGQEAVKMVRDFPDAYESILMDWEMPVLDGPSAVRQIREMGFSMFIVGITGNMLPEDVLYFQSCGADAVIAKPVRLFELEQLWRDNDVSARLMEA